MGHALPQPTDISGLLWVALLVIVPALCGIIVYQYRLIMRLRDQRERELKAENERLEGLLTPIQATQAAILKQLERRRS